MIHELFSRLLSAARRQTAPAPAPSADPATDALCRAIVENSPDCIKLLDRGGRLTWMNAPGQRLMGVTDPDREGLIGKLWLEFWEGDARRAAALALESARRGGTGRFTGPCPTMTGELRWWNVILVPVQSKGALLALSRDVTDLVRAADEQHGLRVAEREAREEADRANVAKDELLATVSHEMRTPINAILGWATLLQSQAKDALCSEMATQIERIALHQLSLVEEVVGQPTFGDAVPAIPLEPLALGDVVAEAIETLTPGSRAKRLRVAWEGAGKDPVWVAGDRQRLRQICLNLLSNAVKFTPPGGDITVSLEKRDSCAVLTVRDTGVGIPAEFLGQIFDRFTQEQSAAEGQGGVGLGLWIVRTLVELHGGTVAVWSEGRGKGAMVSVTLPILRPLAAEVAARHVHVQAAVPVQS